MPTSPDFLPHSESAASAALAAEWAKGMMLPSQALSLHFDFSDAVSDASHALMPGVAVSADGDVFSTPGHSAESVRNVEHTGHEIVPEEEQIQEQSRQGFRVGEIGLMVAYEEGSELTDVPDLCFLPNAPEWFAGLANLHGLVIPVVDLGLFLGVEASSEAKRMLLVLGHDADAVGLLIEGLPERLRWTADMRVALDIAPQKLFAHIKTACLIEDNVWFDLNTPSFLAALEEGMRQA